MRGGREEKEVGRKINDASLHLRDYHTLHPSLFFKASMADENETALGTTRVKQSSPSTQYFGCVAIGL